MAKYGMARVENSRQRGEISVDALSEKVKRSAELIKICKNKLKMTETDVQQILDDLEKNE